MTPDEYEKLPPEEKEHFAKCTECGEIFDRRSLDEVLFHHTDHKPISPHTIKTIREQMPQTKAAGDIKPAPGIFGEKYAFGLSQ